MGTTTTKRNPLCPEECRSLPAPRRMLSGHGFAFLGVSTEVPDACSSPRGAHILTSVLGIRYRRSEAVGPEPSRTRLFYVRGPWREMEWDIQDSVVVPAGR